MSFTHNDIYPMKTFLDGEYFIPNYQREYSWENDEIEDFWNDLSETIKLDEKIKHFFGQIVVHNDEENNRKYIIDGQQRTITSLIFLRVLQLMYHDLYKQSDNSLIEANFSEMEIAKNYIGTKEPYHLTLGDKVDNTYFTNDILESQPKKITNKSHLKKSHINMHNTYGYFYEKILEQLSKKSDIDDKLDILNTFRDNFVKRFTVLYMEATQPEEAYIIFETLNARGKDLEAADLLKNFLFSRVKNDVDNAQKRWMAMLDNLDGVDPTKFIRSFWNSAHPLTNEKALYRSISQQINNPKEGKQLLKDLEDYSTVYHDLMFPEETSLFDNKDLIKHMKNLKTIGATTFYPVIIAMMARKNAFEEKEISDVLSVIEILYFRNSTICKQASNAIERFFAQLANNITNETFDTVDEICGEIRKQIVTDSVFEDAFKIWSGRSKEIIRYILYNIHLHLADDTTQVNPDTDKIHIEHIMPSKITNWNIDENTHQDYLWRLGNLALMSGIANIKASNKPFSEKKAMYKNSVILPNPQVANNIEWGAKEIEERQEQLCKYALEIWKI